MNTITVDFEDVKYRKLITKKDAISFINRVLEELKVADVQLSVSFVGKKTIHELNRGYRNIDNPTDILSFACQDEVDGFDFIVKSKKKNIGDMLICPEVMEENAVAFGVTIQEELHRLLVHGTMHLCGFDHKTNNEDEPMLQKQEKILKKLYKS